MNKIYILKEGKIKNATILSGIFSIFVSSIFYLDDEWGDGADLERVHLEEDNLRDVVVGSKLITKLIHNINESFKNPFFWK